MNDESRAERGQAMVLLLLAMVGLLGFAAVAIDGGNLYLEQRQAQAAADSAVMAAAYAKMNGQADTAGLAAAALASAARNGYVPDDSATWIALQRPPTAGAYAGNNDYFEVIITRTVPTAFAHFVYRGPAQVTAHAIAFGLPQRSPLSGFAILSLRDCRTAGDSNIEITGGGNSGNIETYNGGIWINSTEQNAAQACGLDPGNSAGAGGINADPAYGITSAGAYNYANEDHVSPVPITTGGNGGVPLPDPLADLPVPQCTGNGSGNGSLGNPYQPGNYHGPGQPSLGPGRMAPGLYCLNGTLQMSGNSSNVLEGEGVLLYIGPTGRITFTGQAGLYLGAPHDGNCTGEAGDPTATCTYLGLAVFADRSNCGTFMEAGGNGYFHIRGTVYGACGTFNAHGGGNDPWEVGVWGQVIVGRVEGNGNGSFEVYYDENVVFQLPPYVRLLE